MELKDYYEIYKFYYDDYVKKYLEKDIKKYPAVQCNLKDVEQELAVKYFTHIKFIYENKKHIVERKNFSITFLKDKLKDIMLNQKKHNKKHNQYVSEKKENMMSSIATLYTLLDSSNFSEFKEIIVKTLTFRESSILFGKYYGYKEEEICKGFKISSDYLRKLRKNAEKKLVEVLLSEI